MRSIGFLHFMRKKKHAARFVFLRHFPLFLRMMTLAVVLMGLFTTAYEASARGCEETMGTTSGAVIATDPETGTRVMRTPEPRAQQEYQGPQTIIVAPEVYPGRPGHRPSPLPPPRPFPPPRPQPRN